MSLFYRLLADATVIVHLAYMAFVVFGLVAILIGIVCKWNWIRNSWFRLVHLLAILVVVFESWLGIVCPLTTWEKQLRELAGQSTYQGDFIANWAHELLFFEFEPWVFTVCYTLFGLAVLATFLLAPPSWRHRQSEPA